MTNTTMNARDKIVQRIDTLTEARDSTRNQSQVAIKRVQDFMDSLPKDTIINPRAFADNLKSYANEIAGYQTALDRFETEISCMNWSLHQLDNA